MLSVLFMFVTTSFVANAVLRDGETGYGPIIRCRSSAGLRLPFHRRRQVRIELAPATQ